jgi:hypothetical protein
MRVLVKRLALFLYTTDIHMIAVLELLNKLHFIHELRLSRDERVENNMTLLVI